MIRNPLDARRRTGALLALLLTAFVLAACGGDDDSATDRSGSGEDSGDVDSNAASDDASPEVSGPMRGGADLTAEDGWLEVHDIPVPGPGEGRLTIEGQTIDLEVECGDGLLTEADWMLFSFAANATGVDADGREVEVALERRIVSVEEAESGYGPQEYGEVRVSVGLGGGRAHSALLVSPADNDTDGSRLPVVRVDETGAFTVVEEVRALMMHDEALAGPMELAGTCPDSWSA